MNTQITEAEVVTQPTEEIKVEEKKETLEVDFEALRKVDPMIIFQMMAKERGITLREPKKNCPHCHGTGCRGRKVSTGEPLPCNCILPVIDQYGYQAQYSYSMNRAQRRAAAKRR